MRTVRIVLAAIAVVLGSFVVTPTGVEAHHNATCFPAASGDDIQFWPSTCRDFVVDPGFGVLLGRQRLLQAQSLYTSPAARFTPNFLWYSDERQVTVTDPNEKWSGCETVPGPGNQCAPDRIKSDHGGDVDGTFVLRAYHQPPSITLSVFEYGGMWIAKGCGNWRDIAARPNPVPSITGIKFRDDNRNGVRDTGEQTLANWPIRVTRVASHPWVGQAPGEVWTGTTDASGRYRFDLLGDGPGVYRVEEILQPDWTNSTPISADVTVELGGGDRQYVVDFGNAETVVDVAKTAMTLVDAPSRIDARTPTDLTVSVRIENLGPAHEVDVEDVVVLLPPSDCVVSERRKSFTALLRRGEPVTRSLTFTVTCDRPSNHTFTFVDDLKVTEPLVRDTNLNNNKAELPEIIPVIAETDVGVGAELDCAPRTDVGVEADCSVTITLTNDGYGPIDVTALSKLSLPPDCVSVPALISTPFANLADGETRQVTETYGVTCSDRSFHGIKVSVAAKADDEHVHDLWPDNDTAGDGPSIMEVFHAAELVATSVHLSCNEVLGGGAFTCTAVVDVVNRGPAPDVHVDVSAKLERSDECVAAEGRLQTTDDQLAVDSPATHTFSWTLTCPPSATLHPFRVVTDVAPDASLEPHAVDEAGPIIDEWVVPYCLPTVNPHGRQEPQAPGSGMNEDGFYVFGTLANELGLPVMIRDDASGVEFGPFPIGTRIKWVEGNGAEPSLTAMGGNNGRGRGEALAVDYQVIAQGDAQAFFVDERGVETSVTCLVPPLPK